MKKIQWWQIMIVTLLSNALVLIIHVMVFQREKEVSPMDKYFRSEFERLENKIIKLEVADKNTLEAIKKIDTINFYTEKNYYIRTEARKNIPDSLLNEEWKKFGF